GLHHSPHFVDEGIPNGSKRSIAHLGNAVASHRLVLGAIDVPMAERNRMLARPLRNMVEQSGETILRVYVVEVHTMGAQFPEQRIFVLIDAVPDHRDS